MRIGAAAPIASNVTAVLGPTNTGKTHRAIQRMLDYQSGVFGLPLRLLAREVYDRVSSLVAKDQVALVTGEERHVPARPRFWICTTEAMPTELEVDFVAVDEIQLVSHPSRGHVFTDRLLRARGIHETWFLGSASVQHLIQRLLPAATIQTYPRLSRLSHAGQKSLGKLPPRSAVVAFSIPEVYATAERLRHRKGGAAVVLGALSPRTRAAQVQMYENGEVDYLVATDAIGMGLNLSISHVALAGTRKFDGRKYRDLTVGELAQVAGRAGRHLADGSFGTLAPVPALPEGLARSISEHRVERTRFGLFRNHDLDYTSLETLKESLSVPPRHSVLRRIPDTADGAALEALGRQPDIRRLAADADHVRLLWDTCRIPDYRQLLPEGHHSIVSDVFRGLVAAEGQLSDDWLWKRTERLENYEGDLDTLTSRLAFTRTWIYICQREQWVRSSAEWQLRTRAIEDKLSDAIHERLVQRFVERTQRRFSTKGTKTSGTSQNPFHKLAELRDALEPKVESTNARLLRALENEAVFKLTLQSKGVVEFEGTKVAKMQRGRSAGQPDYKLSLCNPTAPLRKKLERQVGRFCLTALDLRLDAPHLPAHGPLRGILYQLQSGLGAVRTKSIKPQLRLLSAKERAQLASLGIRLGRRYSYVKNSMTQEALRVRDILVTLYSGDIPGFSPQSPTVEHCARFSKEAYLQRGYAVVGPRAIRCDTLEHCLRHLAKDASDTQAVGAMLQTRAEATREILAHLGSAPRSRRGRRKSPKLLTK